MSFINWIMIPHRRVTFFTTAISVIGLIMLILSITKEGERHRENSLVQEGERKYIDKNELQFIKRMNLESFNIIKLNTIGTIFVFLGFFIQQLYNIFYNF